jgi:hypothetical protein
MTTEPGTENEIDQRGTPRKEGLLPGLVAIAVYLLLLAATNVVGVVRGQTHPLYLAFSAVFIAAALGLVRLLRWAWALALAAMVLLAAAFFWQFAKLHLGPALVQGLLNLVFFFYLVRAEVRERLR